MRVAESAEYKERERMTDNMMALFITLHLRGQETDLFEKRQVAKVNHFLTMSVLAILLYLLDSSRVSIYSQVSFKQNFELSQTNPK